jgi:sugar phosphate isomerase/epimerase
MLIAQPVSICFKLRNDHVGSVGMSIPIGINVCSVLQELCTDYLGTLEKISQSGYKHIELMPINVRTQTRFSDMVPVSAVQAKLRELDLTIVAAHEGIPQEQDPLLHDWEPIMQYHNELGSESIVISYLYFNNPEQTLQAAETFNRLGERFKANGLQLYVHNHAHEFLRFGDATLFDMLAEHTDPAYVKFELDLAWIAMLGINPLKIMKKLGPRCDLIHQNDLKPVSFDVQQFMDELQGSADMKAVYRAFDFGRFADLGAGCFNLPGFYAAMKDQGNLRCAIVENETHSGDRFGSIHSDLVTLRQYV